MGSGMGGSVAAHILSGMGLSVLCLEQGRGTDEETLAGDYAESLGASVGPGNYAVFAERLERAGRYSSIVGDVSANSGKPKWFVPFLGSGVGGSTALYGGLLERFRDCDFEPRAHIRHAKGDYLPEAWPLPREDLVAGYEQTEKILNISMLRQVAADPGAQLRQELERLGGHPYRPSWAVADGCPNLGCQGFLCARKCKRHAGQLVPYTLTRARVTRLIVRGAEAQGVVVQQGGQLLGITGRVVVLAGGALGTPSLLLRSTSAAWPRGVGNANDLVGRFLMRHYIDLYVLSLPQGTQVVKDLALDDFYLVQGEKYGSLQAFGTMPPPEVVREEIYWALQLSRSRLMARSVRAIWPLLGLAMKRVFDSKQVMATVVEDVPRPENRVMLDPTTGRILLRYQLVEEEKRRVAAMRGHVARFLKPLSHRLLKQAENNQRLGHVCGTCRMGVDPRSSVVAPSGLVHGTSNVYVADASAFPSSGGTNPSLTVGAYAVTVAHGIARVLGLGVRADPREVVGLPVTLPTSA